MSIANTRNNKNSSRMATRPKIDRSSDNEDDNMSYAASIDSENEMDPVQYDVNFNIQSNYCQELSELLTFFDDASMLNNKNDPTTNIIDRRKGRSYNVPEKKLPKMFKYLEGCRVAKQKLMYSERQLEYSGIMIDFDIYQNNEQQQLNDEIFYTLCQKIIELLMKILNFGDNKKETVYIGITRKPKIAHKEETNCYKDGFHILIPSIQITKGVKKLLLNKLLESELIDQIMVDVEPADIKIKNQKYQRADFLDKNCASVPVFFIGSATKPGNPAYVLTHIYEVTINNDTKNIMLVKNNNLIKSKDFNVCYEFSLNYECPGGTIKKKKYEVIDKYASDVIELNKISKDVEESNKNYGILSMNSIHDSQIKEIKELLDTLNISRADEYAPWRDVLFALANTSYSYKDLAEYFSRKSKKFDMVGFEKMWIEATKGNSKTRKALTLGSIHYWAKLDNPDRYNQHRKQSVYNVLYGMVYQTYKDGILSHSDIAELLHRLLNYKFITDIPEGEKTRVWYEFILDEDDKIDGELYKWRQWQGLPTSLMRYISETLPNLFDMVLKNVKRNYENCSEPRLQKYFSKILENFKATMRKLGDRAFKKNVIAEAEDKFSKMGFCILLDKDPLIRGVANGVLKLSQCGQGPQLIKGYHTHLISKYTDVPYIAFDPFDPLTKKILITLRKMFPDNEPDSFDFTMYYLSSTLDGNPKESIFMLMVGVGSNGKTFLVELHKSAIGSIYGVKLPLNFLTSKNTNSDNATPTIMMLKDASFAYFSESEKHEVLNAARMKEITGQETLAGRKLRQDMVNFKPRCHYLVTTNHDFDIHSHDHGTWRRVLYNPLKIRFIDMANEKIDRADPFQREADDTITDIWTADPEVRGRYLGFMVWMHFWLYHTPEFRGKVKRVPHPHIAFETEKYRRRQDVISSFLAQRLVRVKLPNGETDETQQFAMVDEIQKYILWFQKTQGGLLPAKGVIEMFQNSQIGKHIKTTKRGQFLIGHRFLDSSGEIAANEEYSMKNVFDIEVPEDNFGIQKETPEEFYDKVCKKYTQYKHLFNPDAKFEIDTSIQEDAAEIAEPLKNIKVAQSESNYSREDNIEYNGRILPSGIKLKQLDEPTVNYLTDEFHIEMEGFLPDIDSDEEIDLTANDLTQNDLVD